MLRPFAGARTISLACLFGPLNGIVSLCGRQGIMNTTAQYLGDGCYAEWEHGLLKLTTSNGIETTNTVYLEPEVITRCLSISRPQ
jgi:hypothetical protein